MENEGRIAELLAESLKGQDKIIGELKESNQRLYRLEGKTDKVEERLIKLEDQLVKLNLQTAENSRAILKLADKIDLIADLNTRVTKLEKTVFK